ncbi:MAG TPA: CAP domain-containing protein [Gaiellaceae bacterium]|nr:CAP domain-containing protein [Gaiellaceae bacterium]
MAVALALSEPVATRLGYSPPFTLPRPADDRLSVHVLPGTGGLTVQAGALYPRDDPWLPWLADEGSCPRGEDRAAPPRVQAQVFLCLANFARARQGLGPLVYSRLLSASAQAKAADIVRCDSFAHEACGQAPDAAARALGWRGAFGENLYLSGPPLTSPRVALDRWLSSPGHRENLFRPEWKALGVALLPGSVGPFPHGVVWVTHFGD